MTPIRLAVVSHAGVVEENQGVYAALGRHGVAVDVVVPARWRNEYATDLRPTAHPGLEGAVHPVRVVLAGRPQRHLYVARCSRVLRGVRPDVLLVEEEPFSLAAAEWSRAARALGVPFGVQLAETLDRRLPAVARRIRNDVLARASFVVARSPAAARLASSWGARGRVEVVPHSVVPVALRAEPGPPPTVAFVGRLVADKGVTDLLAAMEHLGGDARLLVAGDGPLRDLVAGAGPRVTWLGSTSHADVDRVYAAAHVTCVPSRTTPRWSEQFGRVVVESLVRGVPVVASSSGELPWVLAQTGGGVLVEERDPVALGAALRGLLEDPAGAAALGAQGRRGVLEHFTDDAAATLLAALVATIS